MPDVVFPLDSTRRFTDQDKIGHNRWHPRHPARRDRQTRGDSFRVHCREWFDGGAIHNDDSADDIRNAPLHTVHALSGPFAVEGAKPGDLLIVDILDLGPIPQEDSGPLAGQGWGGYTGIFAKPNGGAASSPTSSRTHTRRSGTSRDRRRRAGTSRTSRSPASCIRD